MADTPSLDTMFGSNDVETFLGLPKCDDISRSTADIAIIGAPCATPYKSVGPYCADGPRAIRRGIAAFTANVRHHDFDSNGPLLPDDISAVDCGDLAYDGLDAATCRERIRRTVAQAISCGAVPIVLGGDDSIPIPMLEAFAGTGNYTVLQIDAHIDWRDSHEGERLGLSSTMRRASEMDHIDKIIQVGQRGIGSARSGDYEDAIAWGVKFFPARAVCRDGIAPVLDQIERSSRVIICFDCDAMDPAIMPGVIGRAPGGLDYWTMMELLEGVAEKAVIAAMDTVEFMPQRDVDGIGALTAGRIVASAVGLIARQKANKAKA